MEFIILLLFRVLSGAQNALGYARRDTGRILVSAILLLFLVGIAFWFRHLSADLALLLGLVCLAASALGVLGVEDAFNHRISLFPIDIHLFELIATGAALLAFVPVGGNLLYIATSVYPALIIHKGLINLGAGLSFWDTRTDDKSGATFSVPLLGMRIPRSSNAVRITLAIGSLVLAALTFIYHWNISL